MTAMGPGVYLDQSLIIACGMEVRYLLNERKTAWTRRTARL